MYPVCDWSSSSLRTIMDVSARDYLIDVEHAVIVDVKATPARTFDEVAAIKTMIERIKRRFDLKLKWLAADTAW